MKYRLAVACLGLIIVSTAEAGSDSVNPAVAQPYYLLNLDGTKSDSRNGEPNFHINQQQSGIEVVLPVAQAFGAKLRGSYALSDASLDSWCGQYARKQGQAEGFWRNPAQGKVGAYVGRSLNGCSGEQNDSYNLYGAIGEYYFSQGWIGASANYQRANAIHSGGGIDYDSYVLTAEWQPERYTVALHLTRSFQTPAQEDASMVGLPRETLSSNAGDVNLISYLTPNLALNFAFGQTLHNSNSAPTHGTNQFGLRWQPEALGQNLELAAKADITYDTRAINLRLSYYFDSKTSLIYRDRNLRY